MQVVILAGGLGTRLRKLAPDLPKALVRVAGKPFIEHQLDLLRNGGLNRVLLCVGYHGDLVERHVGDGSRFEMQVRYSREDPAQLLGTGGALLNALPLMEESFLVLYGDSYLPTDYPAFVRAFDLSRTPAMMCVFRNEGKWDKSNVRVEGERVIFYSKSAGPGEADFIDYGLSAYRRAVIQSYRGIVLPLDLASIQEDLVRRGEMGAYAVKERFYEIGKPEGLAELENYLATKGEGHG
jgi:N-acetyl-alpha-D-muramate 1-phosphate uridylyltransferase